MSRRLLLPVAFPLFILTSVWVSAASAQATGRIVGSVTDAGSGAPIAEAQIYIAGTGLGSLSRTNGSFILLNVPAGQHELRAERIGLEPVSRQITVSRCFPIPDTERDRNPNI